MLLKDKDPAPFRVIRDDVDTPCIVICDHAGKIFPKKLGDMGISKEDQGKHIVCDIGTEDLGTYIGEKLNAVTFIAHYSRLVIDVNREPERDDCMPEVSDGINIPANKALSDTDRFDRINEIYKPYHDAIENKVCSFLKKGIQPFFLSVHSFTPNMEGEDRPWKIGVLWEDGNQVSPKMIKTLAKNNPDMDIGDNQPYSLQGGKEFNNTVQMHAISRGIPSLIVEFRQDTVDTPEKAKHMADIFLNSLYSLMESEELNLTLKTA